MKLFEICETTAETIAPQSGTLLDSKWVSQTLVKMEGNHVYGTTEIARCRPSAVSRDRTDHL